MEYVEQLNSIEVKFSSSENFTIDEFETFCLKKENENFEEKKIKLKFESTLKELINTYNENENGIFYFFIALLFILN